MKLAVAITLICLKTSDKQAAYREQAKAAAPARIAEVQAELKAITIEAKQGGAGTPKEDKRARAEKIKELQSELKALKAGTLVAPKLAMPFVVGKIGSPPTQEARVFQIIGPEEMLVEMLTFTRAVRQQVGESRLGARSRDTGPFIEHAHLLMIRGVKTNALADHAAYPLPSILEVVGNHTYSTADGASQTVMVLSPFKPAE
jgi:hypothetical protein